MELSDIQPKLEEAARNLSKILHSSTSNIPSLGKKGLEKLIEEARAIKSAGDDIKQYGERIKENLKTFRSAAEKYDKEAEKE